MRDRSQRLQSLGKMISSVLEKLPWKSEMLRQACGVVQNTQDRLRYCNSAGGNEKRGLEEVKILFPALWQEWWRIFRRQLFLGLVPSSTRCEQEPRASTTGRKGQARPRGGLNVGVFALHSSSSRGWSFVHPLAGLVGEDSTAGDTLSPGAWPSNSGTELQDLMLGRVIDTSPNPRPAREPI